MFGYAYGVVEVEFGGVALVARRRNTMECYDVHVGSPDAKLSLPVGKSRERHRHEKGTAKKRRRMRTRENIYIYILYII